MRFLGGGCFPSLPGASWAFPSGWRCSFGVGVLLIAYASYSLLKPKIKPFDSGPVTDTGVGILNGMLVGLTGLGCVVITIWTQMRNWPKDVQRTVFQ
ncbi:MAG: hypothetical protein WB839_02415, partial [Pseudolabrys sp.]